MKRSYPVARLTEAEAAQARELAAKHGAKTAARMLGLCDQNTLRKAACGEPVHPLTASILRSRLSDTTI